MALATRALTTASVFLTKRFSASVTPSTEKPSWWKASWLSRTNFLFFSMLSPSASYSRASLR